MSEPIGVMIVNVEEVRRVSAALCDSLGLMHAIVHNMVEALAQEDEEAVMLYFSLYSAMAKFLVNMAELHVAFTSPEGVEDEEVAHLPFREGKQA